MAVPEDGSATVHMVSDDNGNYTLNLKPGVWYNIAGNSYDPYGQYSFVDIRYTNDEFCKEVTLSPGETIKVKAFVFRTHPPMIFFMKPDPVNGSMRPALSTPVSISGHVYLDDKAISGASVEAISAYRRSNMSTITDDSGAYSLGLDPRTQYNITATYQGMRHTVWPVFVEDNETGVYDINLTRTPRTALAGTAPEDEPWLRHP